jgi:hypothetical protein
LALHHLLGHALCALAKGFQRAALGIEGAVGVALAELAFGRAHLFAGIAERGIGREALAFQLLHHLVQTLLQRALFLAELAEAAFL